MENGGGADDSGVGELWKLPELLGSKVIRDVLKRKVRDGEY